MPNKHKNH